jgi:phosphatidyl-myo-inositol dimannoside synthase
VLGKFTSPKYAGLLEYGGTHGGAYLLRRGMFMPWEIAELLDPEFVQAGLATLQTLPRLSETTAGVNRRRAKISALEMNWYLRNQLLRDADWAGMAHSLEIRVPFVDVAVLRSLAPSLVSANPPDKRDMADAPRRKLPDAILQRRKTGFQIPVRDWLLKGKQKIEGRRQKFAERGLRGWARHVHAQFTGPEVLTRRPRRSVLAHAQTKKAGRTILVLATDAFGGHGGIAKFNRDLLNALCAYPSSDRVVALPRLMPGPPSALPEKLIWETRALGGKLRFLRAAIEASRGASFDAIVCGHINLLPAAFLARRLMQPFPSGLRPPIILVIHGVDAWQPTRSAFSNRLAARADFFIAVSNLTKERFVSWSKADVRRGLILPNCVDLARLAPGPKPAALLKRYGLEERLVLLTLGRLAAAERYKGFDEVLEVLPVLAKKIPNLSYVIAGDGPDKSRLQAKAAALGVAERVVFTGHVSDLEKADHYRLADAYVMPSRGEGFGIVFLEAMACGIPVIGSRVDGSREALRNGELGALVDPSNSEEIMTAIETSLRKPRGSVPPGLEYFSQQQFERRCHQILESVFLAHLPGTPRSDYASNSTPSPKRGSQNETARA